MEKSRMENLSELLTELRKPFSPSVVTWKPGAVGREGTSALGMAYADLRAYQDRLDEVCGMDWAVAYTPWGDRIICHVTINGVTRSSTGEPDAQSERSEIAGTATEAQAFKRACAMFGLGRYLYNLPAVWADYNKEQRRFTDKGLAKLESVIANHYRQAMAKNPVPSIAELDAAVAQSSEEEGERNLAEPNPFHAPPEQDGAQAEPTLAYAEIADSLTGNCAKLASWASGLHINGKGPASEKQYGFLTKTIDQATNGAHTVVLSVLCRRHVTSGNPCSRDLAGKLLDYISTKVTQKDDKGVPVKAADGKAVYIDNTSYRADYVECLRSIAQTVEAWRAGQAVTA